MCLQCDCFSLSSCLLFLAVGGRGPRQEPSRRLGVLRSRVTPEGRLGSQGGSIDREGLT